MFGYRSLLIMGSCVSTDPILPAQPPRLNREAEGEENRARREKADKEYTAWMTFLIVNAGGNP